MVSEIRLYIEGGGDSRATKDELRRGYSEFLKPLRDLARTKHIRWHLVMCGGRGSAFDDFKTALQAHPGAFNGLLVDSEAPVTESPWVHLTGQAGWVTPGISDDHCHLMVQLLETWFIADQEALSSFYGQGYNPNPIPNNPDVEAIPKSTILAALDTATRSTRKGKYAKIPHASRLLGVIEPGRVRSKARHCDRLFRILSDKME